MSYFIVCVGIILSTVGSVSAHADLHLEPFLGYTFGKGGSAGKKDAHGPDFGARVGYRTLGLSVGGEYSISDFTIEESPDISFKPHKIGVFAAYEFPILIRAYGTYIFHSGGDYGANKLENGSGYRLGAGFTGLPLIAINFELMHLEHKKLSSGSSPTHKMDLYGIYVSVPLSL
jgi:hypothetical protein